MIGLTTTCWSTKSLARRLRAKCDVSFKDSAISYYVNCSRLCLRCDALASWSWNGHCLLLARYILLATLYIDASKRTDLSKKEFIIVESTRHRNHGSFERSKVCKNCLSHATTEYWLTNWPWKAETQTKKHACMHDAPRYLVEHLVYSILAWKQSQISDHRAFHSKGLVQGCWAQDLLLLASTRPIYAL